MDGLTLPSATFHAESITADWTVRLDRLGPQLALDMQNEGCLQNPLDRNDCRQWRVSMGEQAWR